MRRILPLTGLLAALTGSALQAQDFTWSGELAQGRTIEIEGVNGEIAAQPASGGRVEVVADKRSRRSDERSVRIEVVEHAGGVTICAVYPTPGNAAQQNRCAPGSEGQMNTRDNDVVVDFAVRVPAGVGLVARTVNGEVEARDLRSDVVARTVNGDVSLSTTGAARAETVNGSIDIAMGPLRGDLEVETVNGSITLSVPAGLNAELDASTVNGGIESDFPMTITGRMDRRNVHAVIGDGGPALRLRTVNGAIAIRRR